MLIRQVRLPRIILGLTVGGALSLAGVILQGIYRNPLVEPFTLGISGGASLGVITSYSIHYPKLYASMKLTVSLAKRISRFSPAGPSGSLGLEKGEK